jgi:DNA polymerase/3'-5' exonuclease PolX
VNVTLLQAMAKAYESMNDKWRALGYRKAIMALKKCDRPITSFEVSFVSSSSANVVRHLHENLKKLAYRIICCIFRV